MEYYANPTIVNTFKESDVFKILVEIKSLKTTVLSQLHSKN